MPIYEYVCAHCEKYHEMFRKISDDPVVPCPDCGGEMKKLISNTSFVLKGSGWYATDYAGKEKKEKKEAPAETNAGTGESPKPDSKETTAPASSPSS